MKILYPIACLFLVAVIFGQKIGNEIQSLDYEPDIEPYESLVPPERPLFEYQKNGIKLDLKIVPSSNDTIIEDDFPNFPAKDISICILDLSLTCVQRRFHHFLDKIKRLKEITLLGNWVKLVRTKELSQDIERRSHSRNGMTDIISQDIDAFFNIFALRINLPSIQGSKRKNQIDVMFDENGLTEGRGKSGKGGKGGGKCKKMMMMMLMMVKMKMMGMMGMTAMKGMMMAGMSLMISKWMLIQKLMDLKKGGGGGGGGGGPWQGGGGGGGGAPLKEIVLLTKGGGGGGSGGGGGGCCGGGGGTPTDSYGAPPPSSSYGAPGGGYDSGGGGWGRSFNTYTSPSSILSRIIPRPEIMGNDKSAVVDASSFYKFTNNVKAPRIATTYESLGPLYKADENNTTVNLSWSKAAYSDSANNETDTGGVISSTQSPPSPQNQFITLRSSYRIVPVKNTRDGPAVDGMENPIYFNDWKNFEFEKRWTTRKQSSIEPGEKVEHTV